MWNKSQSNKGSYWVTKRVIVVASGKFSLTPQITTEQKTLSQFFILRSDEKQWNRTISFIFETTAEVKSLINLSMLVWRKVSDQLISRAFDWVSRTKWKHTSQDTEEEEGRTADSSSFDPAKNRDVMVGSG